MGPDDDSVRRVRAGDDDRLPSTMNDRRRVNARLIAIVSPKQ
jgi:hypothetical protein